MPEQPYPSLFTILIFIFLSLSTSTKVSNSNTLDVEAAGKNVFYQIQIVLVWIQKGIVTLKPTEDALAFPEQSCFPQNSDFYPR